MSADIRIASTSFRFVIDTTTLISYFSEIFDQPSQISEKGLLYISKVFENHRNYIMVIPSVVFVELFDKWFRNQNSSGAEFRAKFISEIYRPIKSNPNIEIREIDYEVFRAFLDLDDEIINLENRDKFILASAIVLKAPLITSDGKIKKYVAKYKPIPELIT